LCAGYHGDALRGVLPNHEKMSEIEGEAHIASMDFELFLLSLRVRVDLIAAMLDCSWFVAVKIFFVVLIIV